MTNGSYRKPQPDVYTLMLVLALLAIILGTVFLYLETKDYGSPPYQGASSSSASDSRPLLALGVSGLNRAGLNRVGLSRAVDLLCLGDGSVHA